MTGNEFLRRIKRLGRERDIAVRFDPSPGKGSHGALYYGGRRTTLKDLRKEISPGLLRDMLVQLGLTRRDLE
jgi:mRNA interferase HicA